MRSSGREEGGGVGIRDGAVEGVDIVDEEISVSAGEG